MISGLRLETRTSQIQSRSAIPLTTTNDIVEFREVKHVIAVL
jgi:hypothetical protein